MSAENQVPISGTAAVGEKMRFILVTDVGSTTTKARFFHMRDGQWRFFAAGEAPTTVEAPYEDVTLGVRNALKEVEELTGHQILSRDGTNILVPYDGKRGVDLYCSTSSAGGGLQMMVVGVMKNITAESANRAALGAGAVVMDVIATNDGRPPYEKIQRVRTLRPDMILLAGGTDGGTVTHVLENAELIKAAEPRPRLGESYQLPILYAGNKDALRQVQSLFEGVLNFSSVDNLRPSLEIENTEPARRAIHELFMEHVMSHAPGYTKLMKWTHVDIMPTPAAEGLAMQLIAKGYGKNTLGVGLGGATTNVYSVIDGRFVRTVSANFGMSYSICNVLKEAGIGNVLRWIPFDIDRKDLENKLKNKMIRPTTIPQTLEELLIEHAVGREALRLGLQHHKTLATRLKGIRVQRDAGSIFEQELEETYVNMMNIGIIAGTGGLLSHSPRRQQSLFIITDAFQPEGVTRLFQDSVFMMPHLGLLSTVDARAAWEIFDKDCLIRLGTVIAPAGTDKRGSISVRIDQADGKSIDQELGFGEITRVPLPEGQEAKAIISPSKHFDIGLGNGERLETEVMGGVVGIVIDARGRPLSLEEGPENSRNLLRWMKALDAYPEDFLRDLTN